MAGTSAAQKQTSSKRLQIEPAKVVSMPSLATMRAGLPYADFEAMAVEMPFTLAQWAEILHLSERTLHRMKAEEKPFAPVQTEKIFSLRRIHELGLQVFGTNAAFSEWLKTPILALELQAPVAVLDLHFGVEKVHNILGRIAYGIYS